MHDYRVLLVGSDEATKSLPPLIETDSEKQVVAEVMAAFHGALSNITEKGYDAVVCWADREDELAGVIRIRKKSPALPILLLTSRQDPGFEVLARQMGATKVAWKHHDAGVVSATIRLAVSTGDLAREMKAQVKQVRATAGEVRALAYENRKLAEAALRAVGKRTRTTFLPLVVEDDLDHALLMVRAFARANVFTSLPIQKSAEDAIAFLSAVAEGGESRRGELPSVVILDLKLPKKSGFDLLQWIRSQPAFQRLPVVILTSSNSPEHVRRAYELGANSYLIKPTRFDALVELVSSLNTYWGHSIQAVS